MVSEYLGTIWVKGQRQAECLLVGFLRTLLTWPELGSLRIVAPHPARVSLETHTQKVILLNIHGPCTRTDIPQTTGGCCKCPETRGVGVGVTEWKSSATGNPAWLLKLSVSEVHLHPSETKRQNLEYFMWAILHFPTKFSTMEPFWNVLIFPQWFQH